MTPPDATIALLSGGSEINCVFSVPPFQFQQLEKAGIRTVLNSYDVMEGPHTFTVSWTSARALLAFTRTSVTPALSSARV